MDENTKKYRLVKGIANALLMTEDFSIQNNQSQLDGITRIVDRIFRNSGIDLPTDEIRGIVMGEVYDEYWTEILCQSFDYGKGVHAIV